MVVFIIPFVSKATSRDWSAACEYLRQTLGSILRQTSKDFIALVVCNETPDSLPIDNRIHVVADTFAQPRTWEQIHLDQKLKVKRGLVAARKYGSNYVMRADSDDLIHKDLVRYVLDNGGPGWYVDQGYVYAGHKRIIYARGKLYSTCATSNVVRVEESDFPRAMDTPSEDYLEVVWQHQLLKPYFVKRGTPLKPFPFRAAVYRVHGRSLGGNKLFRTTNVRRIAWRIFGIRPLTRKIQTDFGL